LLLAWLLVLLLLFLAILKEFIDKFAELASELRVVLPLAECSKMDVKNI
jgi:hypothetical protein